MKDRAMQVLYLLALELVAETVADSNSYGFRKERSTANAREHCFIDLARESAPKWILGGAQSMIEKQMTQFVLFCKYLNEQINESRTGEEVNKVGLLITGVMIRFFILCFINRI
jgi:hypothetical protein